MHPSTGRTRAPSARLRGDMTGRDARGSKTATVHELSVSNTLNECGAEQVMALLAVFPVALKQHLRGELNEPEIKAVYFLYRPCVPRSAPTPEKGGGDAWAASGE